MTDETNTGLEETTGFETTGFETAGLDDVTETSEYLETDGSIQGQNYVCLSFVSPERVITQKELFVFNKYMSQVCGDFEKKIDELTKNASDTFKNKIRSSLRDELHYHMRYTYDQFVNKYDDFKYKFNDQLDKLFEKQSNGKTSVRGVKVRGSYGSYAEAERRAKALQRKDRSFNVFVGAVGAWLPWDPCADHIENEEYLEEELNTLMKEYKENEIRKDLFYEQQKRETQQDAMKKTMEEKKKNDKKQQDIAEEMEEVDPWMKTKFETTVDALPDAPTDAPTDAPETEIMDI